MRWDKECEKVLQGIQNYLGGIPTLLKPKLGKPLILYLAISEYATSGVLVRDKWKEQMPIYYISKSLQGVKTRYPEIKKISLCPVDVSEEVEALFESAYNTSPYCSSTGTSITKA